MLAPASRGETGTLSSQLDVLGSGGTPALHFIVLYCIQTCLPTATEERKGGGLQSPIKLLEKQLKQHVSFAIVSAFIKD